MKKNTCTTLIVSTFVVSLLLIGGCGKKTVVPPSQSGDANGTAIIGGKDINYPMAQGGGYSEENLPIEGTLDDSTGAANQGRSLTGIDQQSYEYKQTHGRSSTGLSPIYFEFDQAGVRPAMTEVLVNNADYLNSISGVHIVIEGNSDERGTNEYNLALGERRAINTQQYLINLGVDSMRMRTVSYGEEKPLFLDQDEDSYRLNRRVDFVVE